MDFSPPTPSNLTKFEYTPATLSLIDERGVILLKILLPFGSDEDGLIQKVEIQTKKMTAVIEAETVKAIIFLSAKGFFLRLSKYLNTAIKRLIDKIFKK